MPHVGPPITVDVAFHEDQRITLGTTWALIETDDGGATWHWMCEEAVGFGGTFVPEFGYLPDASLIATTPSAVGLSETADRCTWSAALDPPAFASHVAVMPGGVAIATVGSDVYGDGALLGHVADGISYIESVGIASDAMLYVSAETPEFTWRMFRSDDGGAHWGELDVTPFGLAGCTIQRLQVAAATPALVFARVKFADCTAVGDDLWRSDDAGGSWTRVFQSEDDITGLVVRQGGDVLLGEHRGGIRVSTDGGQSFGDPIDPLLEVDCLRERDDGLLFLCGNDVVDAALSTSVDAQSWTPIYRYSDTTDPWLCPLGAPQRDICADERWCIWVCAHEILDPSCSCNPPVPDAGPPDPPPDPKGCCSTGSPDAAVLLAAVIGVAICRPRRRGKVAP